MKAIIFDMDGVLILTEKMHYHSYCEVCKKYDCKLSQKDYNEFFAGKRTAEAFSVFLESKGKSKSLVANMVTEFRNIKRNILNNEIKKFISLRKGIKTNLRKIRHKGFKLAIATSTIKEFTDKIIKEFDLGKYFDEIITAEDVSKGKPNPQVYLLAAKRLKVDPSNCIVIEDAENGIESAKNAGMVCIAIKDKSLGKRDLSRADCTIEDLHELNDDLLNDLYHSR